MTLIVSHLGKFQSTLPTRGSDGGRARQRCGHWSFNPRSPRGGATSSPACTVMFCGFQSTLPTRGSDITVCGAVLLLFLCFNPRSPRGGATGDAENFHDVAQFQSTLPTRGSDDFIAGLVEVVAVSIHAPHEGERLWAEARGIQSKAVSIHAPHEGERPVMLP